MYILIALVSELLLKMIFNWQIEYSITWKIWRPTFKQLPADIGYSSPVTCRYSQ